VWKWTTIVVSVLLPDKTRCICCLFWTKTKLLYDIFWCFGTVTITCCNPTLSAMIEHRVLDTLTLTHADHVTPKSTKQRWLWLIHTKDWDKNTVHEKKYFHTSKTTFSNQCRSRCWMCLLSLWWGEGLTEKMQYGCHHSGIFLIGEIWLVATVPSLPYLYSERNIVLFPPLYWSDSSSYLTDSFSHTNGGDPRPWRGKQRSPSKNKVSPKWLTCRLSADAKIYRCLMGFIVAIAKCANMRGPFFPSWPQAFTWYASCVRMCKWCCIIMNVIIVFITDGSRI